MSVVHLAAVLALLAGVLPAQRNELSIQAGGTLTQRRSIAVPSALEQLVGTGALRGGNGLAGGMVYRLRLVTVGPAVIMAEVPAFAVQATNTGLSPLLPRPILLNTSGVSGYFTPGGAVRLFPDARLSPYVFFGGGWARVVEAQLTSISPLRADFVNERVWAIGYGGGVDLRLFRFLALRGELRNFFTGAPAVTIGLPAESRQRNTLLITGGLAFKF